MERGSIFYMSRYLFQLSAAANLTLNLPELVLGRSINKFWFNLERVYAISVGLTDVREIGKERKGKELYLSV